MSEPPRVLCVCDWLVKYTAGLARGLAEAGAEVALLTRDHDFEFGGRPGAMRRYVAEVLEGRVEHLVLGGRPREPRAYADAVRVGRAVRRFAPGVVHLQSTVVNDPRLPVVAGARPGRYALTVHDVTTHPGDPAHGTLRRRAEGLLVRHAAVTFVHAEPLAADLRREWGPVPAAVVPHGVDPPQPLPFPDRPRLLFFGRLSYYKGLDVLLDAMPAVWAEAPDLEVDVVGAGELPDHAALEDPRVHVRHEHVADAELAQVFAPASCVVLPYREASQSGVGSQAKRFGRGMVVSGVGGLPELVADGSGLVVPPGDPGALAQALVRVVGEPGLAAELARAAGAGMRAASWPRVGELTLEAYARYGLSPR